MNRGVCLLLVSCCLVALGGCVSDKVEDRSMLTAYQQRLVEWGPQDRSDEHEPGAPESLDLLRPVDTGAEPVPDLEIRVDPNSGQQTVALTIEEAIVRALSNSPEIRVVSFDPEIARQQIAQQAAAFDPTTFARLNYEDQDNPRNSIYEPGQAETRLMESGVRQRTVLGSEWSASYALTRVWDDLFGRTLPTRYEPALIFELRQPLLRDAGPQVNLAGVNVATLNHEAALLGFREKAEAVATAAITAYWQLVQARRDVEIQQQLLAQTTETLNKVMGRQQIDATDVQVKQAEAQLKSREATLLVLEKRMQDAQDGLARLLADPQINTTSEIELVPASEPEIADEPPESATMLEPALSTAMQHNPAVQRARLGVRIADINLTVAKNQEMPRLDLVGSTRAQGLARDRFDAHDQLDSGDYMTYAVGLTLEYPLGNRERHAEWLRRKLERRKAQSVLHNTADQVVMQVRERMRQVRTTLAEVKVQREVAEAARIQLKALEESEPVRERLTPEFLLVKLDAQETHARAQRAGVDALVNFNISVAELAQATGTVLQLRSIDASLSTITDTVGQAPPWQDAGLSGAAQ